MMSRKKSEMVVREKHGTFMCYMWKHRVPTITLKDC